MIAGALRRLEETGELGKALIAGVPGSGLVVLDASMRILLVDGVPSGFRARDDMLMRAMADVLPRPAWNVLEPRYAAAMRGEAQSFEYDAVSEPTTHWIRLAPIRDDGAVVGVLCLSQDITPETLALRELTASEELQSSVLAALEEGLAVIGATGQLLQANPAACRILGLDLASARADPRWWERLAARRSDDGSPLNVGAGVMRSGRGVWDVGLELERAGGPTISLSANYLPLRGPDGTVSGLVISFRDVTDRDREQAGMLELQDRLREAHEVAAMASWEWDPASGEVLVFHALPESSGLTGTQASLEELLALAPAAERRSLGEYLAALVRGDRDVSVRRHRHAVAGQEVWLETRSRAVRDADGRLLCVRGTSQDVTEQELAKHELASSRNFLKETLDSLTSSVVVLDQDGEIMATNLAWRRFCLENDGDSASCAGNYLAACDGAPQDEWAQRARAGVRSILDGTESEFSMEYPCHSPTEMRWFSLRATRYSGEGPARVVVNHADVTPRRRAQAEVKTQAALLDEIDVGVVATDLDRRITHWNRGAEKLYGWTSEEAIGQHAGELIVPSDGSDVSRMAALLERDGHWEGQFAITRKDGSTFPAFVRDRFVTATDGTRVGMIGVSVDMSERVASERALRSARDYLRAVTDSVGEGIYTADTNGRLTYLNEAAEDILGWTLEEVRGSVMHEIAHSRRPDGSELAIEDCPIQRAVRDGRRVRVRDEVFISRDGHAVPVSYTASPFETDDGVHGCVVAFEDVTESREHQASLERDVEKLAAISRLQEALSEERMLLYAQPIIDLRSGAIVQQELLLRVREHDGAIVGPSAYLPIAEEYRLIGDIDRWVIARGAQLAASGLPVHVNVSARSIGDPSILEHVERWIAQTGAEPKLIVFEITETALVEDEAAARHFAERIHALGCKLALDDFGTGYGSFTFLKQLPIDYLKIDVEFVRDLATSPASRHVIEAVVALAGAFSLQTIGEGVEDARTLELLRELGVDFAQGFHIGRPAPLAPASAAARREGIPTYASSCDRRQSSIRTRKDPSHAAN